MRLNLSDLRRNFEIAEQKAGLVRGRLTDSSVAGRLKVSRSPMS